MQLISLGNLGGLICHWVKTNVIFNPFYLTGAHLFNVIELFLKNNTNIVKQIHIKRRHREHDFRWDRMSLS